MYELARSHDSIANNRSESEARLLSQEIDFRDWNKIVAPSRSTAEGSFGDLILTAGGDELKTLLAEHPEFFEREYGGLYGRRTPAPVETPIEDVDPDTVTESERQQSKNKIGQFLRYFQFGLGGMTAETGQQAFIDSEEMKMVDQAWDELKLGKINGVPIKGWTSEMFEEVEDYVRNCGRDNLPKPAALIAMENFLADKFIPYERTRVKFDSQA